MAACYTISGNNLIIPGMLLLLCGVRGRAAYTVNLSCVRSNSEWVTHRWDGFPSLGWAALKPSAFLKSSTKSGVFPVAKIFLKCSLFCEKAMKAMQISNPGFFCTTD